MENGPAANTILQSVLRASGGRVTASSKMREEFDVKRKSGETARRRFLVEEKFDLSARLQKL
jgi:hypothetical protein